MEPSCTVHVLGLKQLQVRRSWQASGGHERGGRWQVRQCTKLRELIKEMDAVRLSKIEAIKLRVAMKEVDAGKVRQLSCSDF